jgi:aminocarboxymuconate-semialdehyde decarboxylase
MRIDVHAHYYPPEVVDAYTRLGRLSGNPQMAPAGRVTLDERLDLLVEAGIDLQILCCGANQPYVDRAEEAVAIARLVNDLYADLSKGPNTRFGAFATLPLPHVDAAIDEMGRCLDTLGMLGVNIGTSVAGRPLDDPLFAPVLAELDRRQAVLFLHPQGVGAGPMADAYGMTFMIGACFEDTITSIRLVMSGLTARYPNVRIIVPHLGGTLPFLMQRIEDHTQRMLYSGQPVAVTQPSAAIRSLYFDTVNNYPAALRCSCEAVGADHIMLGTDFPFLFVKPCVEYIQQSGLPAQDIDTILNRSAQRLLGLPG